MWLSAIVLLVFAAHTGFLLRDGAFMGPILMSPAVLTALFLLPSAPLALWESVIWLRRRWRNGPVVSSSIHIAVMVVVFAYAFSPGLLVNDYLCDASFRIQLRPWLQPWAAQILSVPPKDAIDPGRNLPFVRASLVPKTRLHGPEMVLLHSPVVVEGTSHGAYGANQAFVEVVYGGGFGHWGYFVGRPTLTVSGDRYTHVRKVDAGVYRFAD